jgi:hypothetical protein
VFDVMGDPVAEVVVTAERLSFLTPAVRRVIRLKSAQTNDLGDFRIHGLTPGKYYVSAARGGTEGRDAPTFFPGVSSISEATPIEVRAGQDSLGVSMQLAPPRFGDVAGIVMNSNGAPFGGANVWLVPSRFDGVQVGAHASAITDAAGRFAINNVSPGDYRLEVFARAWMEKYAVVGDAAGPPPELASVPVSIASGRTEVLSVRTSTGFRVTGQMFVDGVPISAAAWRRSPRHCGGADSVDSFRDVDSGHGRRFRGRYVRTYRCARPPLPDDANTSARGRPITTRVWVARTSASVALRSRETLRASRFT